MVLRNFIIIPVRTAKVVILLVDYSSIKLTSSAKNAQSVNFILFKIRSVFLVRMGFIITLMMGSVLLVLNPQTISKVIILVNTVLMEATSTQHLSNVFSALMVPNTMLLWESAQNN